MKVGKSHEKACVQVSVCVCVYGFRSVCVCERCISERESVRAHECVCKYVCKCVRA